jgi:hypothetical protein
MWLKVLAKRPWLIFLLLCLFLRIYAALCPLEAVDAVPMPDDAYISLGLARSMAQGHGPLFCGVFTNGFQTIYVFLMVPVYWLFPHDLFIPVHVALVLLAIFDTLALFLLLRLLERKGKTKLTLMLIAAFWALNLYRLQMAINGLETVIAMFFIVACFALYLNITPTSESRRSCFFLGLMLGLAMLARIDNAILAFVIFIGLYVRLLREHIPLKARLEKLAWLCAGGILVYLPWLAYSFHYTGQIFPESGKAVRLLSLDNVRHNPPFIKEALEVLFSSNLLIIVIAAALLFFFFLIAGRPAGDRLAELRARFEDYDVLLAFCLILTLAYVFYAYGYWAFFRYLYPVSLLLLLYMAEMIDIFVKKISNARQQALFVAAILGLFLLANILNPVYYRLFIARTNRHSGYMKLGLWADANFAPGTVVGSGQSGALGYYAGNLKVINLDGVVNHESYLALRERHFMDYARKIGLQYIIGWDSEIRHFKRSSRGYRKGELVFVKAISDFKDFGNRHWKIYRVTPAFERKRNL